MYFVYDENKCKAEGMTKEQIINAIAEATGVTPQHVDEGFITTIKETNHNHSIHIWKGTAAEFAVLPSLDDDTFYIISDDTTIQDIESALEETQQSLSDVTETVNDLSEDTGWQNITKTNLSSQSVVVGKYRVIGKIAYIDLNYKLNDFTTDESSTSVIIDLPVLLDLSGKQGIICWADNSSQSDAAKAAILSVSGSVTTFRADYNIPSGNTTWISASFAYPVAAAAS